MKCAEIQMQRRLWEEPKQSMNSIKVTALTKNIGKNLILIWEWQVKLARILVQCYTVCVTTDISTYDNKHVNNVVLSVVKKKQHNMVPFVAERLTLIKHIVSPCKRDSLENYYLCEATASPLK